MSYQIVNPTLPVVLQEIEDILKDYPAYPYQVAFSIRELRQRLLVHVLSNILNHYTVIADSQELPRNIKSLSRPAEERLCLENVIHGGILHILRENADWIGLDIAQK